MAAAVLAGNLTAFLVYGFDKMQARNDGGRVSERVLLVLAVIGGIGAWTGCEAFRHKTRKQPFRAWLTMAVILHVGLAFALLAIPKA